MATAQPTIAAGITAPPLVGHTVQTGWAKALIPSFSDCFFIALFVWLFVAGPHGWDSLLGDADVGWHIRTGEWILQHHTVPTHDLFSFSKEGAPWFAWEWLSDVSFALLFRAAGFKGIVLFTGVVIGVYSTIMLRCTFWRGANAMIALPIVLLGVGSSTVHFLARPHVFTLLFLAISFWLLACDSRQNSRYVWLLIPLTVLWVNLHGGFFMFLACLALLIFGSAAETLLGVRVPGSGRWGSVRRYMLLFAGCAAASLINPYGINLHKHVAEYLRSDWIRNNVQEFQAPTFRTEGQLQLEVVLILALLIVPMLLRGRRITEALWILFLAHSSLTSLRHAPLFCLLAVPLIASELSFTWTRAAINLPRSSLLRTLHTLGSDLSVPFQRSSVWILLTIVLVAWAPLNWPADFPKELFPTSVVAHYSDRLQNGRVLTTDQWGDYLIFHFYPRLKVYVDGRSDLYGEQLGQEYLHVLQLSSDWQQIFKRRGFDTVLLGPEWPLVQMLRQSPDWRIAEENKKAILLVRRDNSPSQSASSPSPTAGLVLKKTRPEANENLQHRRTLYTGDRRNERG